jgi:hypothetical protein
MTYSANISFTNAVERDPFLAATNFEWDFDVWHSDIVAQCTEQTTSSWAGPVAQIHWDAACMDPEHPGTAMLEVQLRIGDTPAETLSMPAPAAKATDAERAAAADALNDFAVRLLADARSLPIFDDRTFRQWDVTEHPAGLVAYLNIIFDEPTEPTDTERDAINSQLSDFSRRHLFALVESLLRAGVFVRRDQVRDAWAASGGGERSSSLLPR